MKKLLTDKKTGRQMTILYDNQYLPALGEDGICYFLFTSNLTDYFGEPRTDCTIVDLENQMAIKPETLLSVGIEEPIKFTLDKEAFDKANSLEEYAKMLRDKGIIGSSGD